MKKESRTRHPAGFWLLRSSTGSYSPNLCFLISPPLLFCISVFFGLVQDGGIKAADRVVAVEDDPVAGLSSDKVHHAGCGGAVHDRAD